MRRVLTLVLCLSAASGAAAATITGVASVIDGDTIEIHGQRIRLQGIDAPESRQLCEKDGRRYQCGKEAANALARRIGRRTVRCRKRAIDKYGRTVAICRTGGTDLNRWMVAHGHAIAYRKYSTAYVSAEEEAKGAGRGIWAGTFEEPSRWRKHKGNRRMARRDTSSRQGWWPFRLPAWVRGYYRRDGTYVRGHFRWR